MKYIKPKNETEENAAYTNANPLTGVKGSTIDAAAIEHPMREILSVITGAGLTPSDTDLTQLKQAIDALIDEKTKEVITQISETSGSISLACNKNYAVSLSDTTTFVLPTPTDTSVKNTIEVEIQSTGAIAINWGTNGFVFGVAPTIGAGNYVILYEWSTKTNAWKCGAYIRS